MERIANRRPPPHRPRNRRTFIVWALRLGVTVAVLGLFATIVGLVYLKLSRIEGPTMVVIGGQEATVEPSDTLNPAERAYLRGYLMLHAADIEKSAGNDSSPLAFTIEQGETAIDIAESLEEANLVADATLFRFYLRYYDLDSGLEAGEFELNQRMTIPEIAQALSNALADEIEIRITEGWRLEQIGDFLLENPQFGIDPNEFLLLTRRLPAMADEAAGDGAASGTDAGGVTSYDFMPGIPDGATLEGYLFPDTYRLPADATADDLISTVLYTFGQRVTAEMRQAMAERGLTIHQAITLASIVEREAQLAQERPIIASVFLNRLAQGMKLDADPTVQYALGFQQSTGQWWKRPLTFDDLETESPYNTYRNVGLPPGPIANPGLASIQAVTYPAETDYMFFVVDCTAETAGAHVFSQTFEEHQANVARCQ